MAKSKKKAHKKAVRKSAPRKTTAKKANKKKATLVFTGMKLTRADVKKIKVEAFKPDIKSTMDLPFRINERDLFRPLREEITAKLKKSGDAIELRGQPGQKYHDLYNRLSSVMVRPEFPKPAKGMQYVRRQGKSISCVNKDTIAIDAAPVVVLTLAKKGTKIPRDPRTKKTEAK